MIVDYVIQMGKGDEPASHHLGAAPNNVRRINLLDPQGALSHGIPHILKGLADLGLTPSEIALDLLVVASAVSAADTSLNRETKTEDNWTRQFRLHVPVHDPNKWNSASQLLSRMLQFLTGDFWSFSFRARPPEFQLLVKSSEEMPMIKFDSVSLLSGGLDSLIGAIDLLEKGRTPLFVSHSWDTQASAAQKRLLAKFKTFYKKRKFGLVKAAIGFDKNDLASAGSDGNQRARSFLFYSMATVAADSLKGAQKVLIPENGLIALNIPMEPFRLGSLSTRTAHPFFIRSMADLAKLLGMEVEYENPYRFKTKGEMVSECTNLAFLRTIAADSMSCSSPGKTRWTGRPPQHCGYCVPCLIRRASLKVGLGSDDKTPYTVDELADNFDSRTSTGENIRSFKLAAKRAEEEPKLHRFLVQKTGPLDKSDIVEYAAMYGRGMKEVGNLLRRAKSKHD